MKIKERKNILKPLNSFFEIQAEEFESSYAWTIENSLYKDFLVLTISSEDEDNSGFGNLIISVQTSQGIFELHNCENYFISQTEEVFFWSEIENSISCLIIGKQATCSFFSNVESSILEKDITELNPAKILASVQVSIINNLE